jgi:hypothetical protein
MALWSRSARLSSEVRNSLALQDGERVLGVATTTDGSTIVATNLSVFVPTQSGHHRIGWEQVDKAGWDRAEETLWVLETAQLGARPHRWRVHIDDPGPVIDLVRERVNATVIVSQHVPLAGERGVRVVGRRPPGTDQLLWSVAVDPGIDVTDPRLRRMIEEAVAGVRRQIGD